MHISFHSSFRKITHFISPDTHAHMHTHLLSLLLMHWHISTEGKLQITTDTPNCGRENSLSSMSQWKCTPNFNLSSSHCNIKPQLKRPSTLNTGTYKTNKLFFIWRGSQKYWLHEVYMGLPVAFETTTSSGSYPERGRGNLGLWAMGAQ